MTCLELLIAGEEGPELTVFRTTPELQYKMKLKVKRGPLGAHANFVSHPPPILDFRPCTGQY